MDNNLDKIYVIKGNVAETGMIACCPDSMTDQEILARCNVENPGRTEKGWIKVIRNESDLEKFALPNDCLPTQCDNEAMKNNRKHYLILY